MSSFSLMSKLQTVLVIVLNEFALIKRDKENPVLGLLGLKKCLHCVTFR